MSKTIKLQEHAVCKRLEVSGKDLLKIDRTDLVLMAFMLHLVREFEATLLQFIDEDLVYGPVHSSIGQEAVAAATAAVLRKTDKLGSTHRAHGHFLAKAAMYYAPDNYQPLQDEITPAMQEAVNKSLAEIMGLAAGWCRGRGGSMHLYHGESGNLGSNGIVGGGIPMATGAAWAEKLRSRDTVVVSFFGDGAINQGCFHEVANMAALWDIPVIYFVENNHYAVATSTKESSYITDLGLRSVSYGIDSLIVDGMDPVSVYVALSKVVDRMRTKPFPFLIEAKTYRYYHHNGPMIGSLFGYRSQQEEQEWLARDPVITFPRTLVAEGLMSEREGKALQRKARASVDEAVAFCTAEKDGKRYIPAAKWPSVETATDDIRCEEDLFADVTFVEREDFRNVKAMTYVEAIAGVTQWNMERDERVIVLGEEVANFGGGAYQATKGIPQVFPERLINTPISECGFVGMAAGAAAMGLRPVVEIMYPDFTLVAADQLFNQIAKLRYMFGGQISFPLVLRTRFAVGSGYGGQHSMNPVGLFGLFSGWRIMAPSNPFDYVGLFNTALRFNDPVLMIDEHRLYPEKGDVPADTMDYYVQYGKAKVVREGTDVTVLSYLKGVRNCLAAAEEAAADGISAEVIDLRTLDYIGLDYETIGLSVKKTKSVLIVEDTPRSMGLAGRLSDEIQERFFDYLDCPIAKLTMPDVPPPVSRVLEQAMIPDPAKIKSKIIQGGRHHS